jgi:DNA-binding transcriptional MerR regulator
MTDADDDKKLFKIGEVCKVADVQPYVLRYWETEFPSLAPNKSGGGQRLYTKREIDIILRIKQLLYSEGFTIAGAKKKLETEMEGGAVPPPATAPIATSKPAAATGKATRASNKAIADVKKELRALLEMLKE